MRSQLSPIGKMGICSFHSIIVRRYIAASLKDHSVRVIDPLSGKEIAVLHLALLRSRHTTRICTPPGL